MNIPEQILSMNKIMNRHDFVEPGWHMRPEGKFYHLMVCINHIIGCLQCETIAMQSEAIAMFSYRAHNILTSPEAEDLATDYKAIAAYYVYIVDSWMRDACPQAFDRIAPFIIPEPTDAEKDKARRFIPSI
ncbi:hypothetical protein [Synechococcus sp. CCAP 1479/9]|uniref:hypothetical protein n=1 Tax=Synechococcus sp. CCAP 1479/9 TaxID=1221593 RepID=UPI001C23EF8F|nr:hypothetical protein [Synechococcus sp. CCAP 1479/9]